MMSHLGANSSHRETTAGHYGGGGDSGGGREIQISVEAVETGL